MKRAYGFVLAGLLVGTPLLAPSLAVGQTQFEGVEISGELELGWRLFLDRPDREDRSKFEEYRDIPSGPFLKDLLIQIETEDGGFATELQAHQPGEDDQSFSLGISQRGQHYFEFEWDQIPHNFSYNAQSLFNGSPGNLTIPDSVQTTLQDAAAILDIATIGDTINDNVRDIDLGVRRDTAEISYRFTPTSEWDFRLGYTREVRNGDRAFAGNIGTNNTSGFNTVEFPEPIDYTTHEVRASAEYAGDTWVAGLSYIGSFFTNEFDSVRWSRKIGQSVKVYSTR
jgi:hypothetical protein